MKPEHYPKLDATVVEGDELRIEDTRPCAVSAVRLLSGLEAQLLLACDTARTASGLAKECNATEEEVREGLASLQLQKLLIEMDGHYASLPCSGTGRCVGRQEGRLPRLKYERPRVPGSLTSYPSRLTAPVMKCCGSSRAPPDQAEGIRSASSRIM